MLNFLEMEFGLKKVKFFFNFLINSFLKIKLEYFFSKFFFKKKPVIFRPSIQSVRSTLLFSVLKHLGILNSFLSYFFPTLNETALPVFGEIKQIS